MRCSLASCWKQISDTEYHYPQWDTPKGALGVHQIIIGFTLYHQLSNPKRAVTDRQKPVRALCIAQLCTHDVNADHKLFLWPLPQLPLISLGKSQFRCSAKKKWCKIYGQCNNCGYRSVMKVFPQTGLKHTEYFKISFFKLSILLSKMRHVEHDF